MTVSVFTQLGLVEMTRKRTREPLAHILCEPCPLCQARGQVKTARAMCFEILREINANRDCSTKRANLGSWRPSKVIDLFLEDESQSLAMLSDFVGKPGVDAGRDCVLAGAVRHCFDVSESEINKNDSV